MAISECVKVGEPFPMRCKMCGYRWRCTDPNNTEKGKP